MALCCMQHAQHAHPSCTLHLQPSPAIPNGTMAMLAMLCSMPIATNADTGRKAPRNLPVNVVEAVACQMAMHTSQLHMTPRICIGRCCRCGYCIPMCARVNKHIASPQQHGIIIMNLFQLTSACVKGSEVLAIAIACRTQAQHQPQDMYQQPSRCRLTHILRNSSLMCLMRHMQCMACL